MAEPAASLVAAVTTAGVVSIAGVTLGLQYDVLAAGLAGGLWSLSYQPPAPAWRKGLSAVVSALVAGYLAPVGAAILSSLLSQAAPGVTVDLLRLPAAVVVGLLTHQVIGPLVLKLAQRRADEVVP